MLGDTYEHLDIDERFLASVKAESKLGESSIVVEWIEDNSFAHNDPRYAPVGNYMFLSVGECVDRVA